MEVVAKTMGRVGRPAIAGPEGQSPRRWVTKEQLNLIGFWSLYRKEVRRFLAVGAQTVSGPALQALLLLLVFAVALGRAELEIGNLSYLQFLAPGLVMMTVIQNAFANTSSSLVIGKLNGTIADYLMAPLGPRELTFAIAFGGVTRGVLVGAVVWAVMLPFVPLRPTLPLLALGTCLLAAFVVSCLGILTGLWVEKMDQLAVANNVVVTPLAFLSGTFYSVAQLPEPLSAVAHLNPFFHMIDGFRFAMTGYAESDVATGNVVLAVLALLLALLCQRLFAIGWRLKP